MFRQRDYPRTLWIGEHEWRVRFFRRFDDPSIAGYCDPSVQEIQIVQGLWPMERLRVFVHELIHALEFEYGFELPHHLVERLDRPLARAVADNAQGGSRRPKKAAKREDRG